MSAERLFQLKKEGETVDTLLGGRLRVLQKKRGYRFSIDSILLAHFVRFGKHARACDLGAGSGVISLILASNFKKAKIAGVEIQHDLVDMTKRSIELNSMQELFKIFHGDVRRIEELFERESFDVVFFNPPYRKLNSGRINPEREKAIARHEIKGTLSDFLSAAEYLLEDGGHVYLIYPAIRSVELMFRMRTLSLEPKRLRMVHSNVSSRAEFVLAEGIKRGGEELRIESPLFIYKDGGSYSKEMEDIFREVNYPHSSAD
jgi:tRNA1Val (adenine37-N6)-methyltransferase